MRGTLVGTFTLNNENVRLFITGEDTAFTAAYLIGRPDDYGPPMIVIGCAGVETFMEIMASLLHEILEFCLHRRRLAYNRGGDMFTSIANHLFVLNHEDMNCITEDMAAFLCACTEPLEVAWGELNKPNKGEKKGKIKR